MLSYLLSALNRLLPFATPGTPLVQDLIHLAAVCTLLYFAPQIQQHFNTRASDQEVHETSTENHTAPAEAAESVETDFHHEPAPIPEPAARINVPPTDHEEQLPVDGPAFPPEDQPGPAAPRAGPSRAVGAKKAASIARRDQRRAYNEFVRSQAEAAKAQDAEGAAEREAILAAEKARREGVQAELRERERREREVRKAAEEKVREEERAVRERVVQRVARGVGGGVDLKAVALEVGRDVAWVEELVRASGIVKAVDGSLVMITQEKWVVEVRREDVEECWRRVADSGRESIGYEDVGRVLEEVVRSRAVAA